MLNFQSKHASFEQRNQLIADRLPHTGSWILDVGSNTGFTTQFLGNLGHYALGVEKMEKEYATACGIAGQTSAFMHIGVSPAFFANSPDWSAILLLSVLHRIYAFDGEACMRDVLRQCGLKTETLFVEGSTRHARYRDQGQPSPPFADQDVDAATAWHERLFDEVLGDDWSVQSTHVLAHTKKEPHRILFHLTKKSRGLEPLRLRPGDVIELDPARIGFLQFPEFHKLHLTTPGAFGQAPPGEWDAVLDRSCFWGARYEGGRDQPVGMVSLSKYHFLTALTQRFHEGTAWEDTAWLTWMRETAPSRYNTEQKIRKRLRLIERLYEDCASGKYRISGDDLPMVNIGRSDRIAIEDGRHRICVAKAAGVKRIAVRINALHPESRFAL